MSQGNDFANYASSVGDQSTASEDVWFVAVSSDDIKQMNLDQLDEAFRLGIVTAQTAVWTEGMEAWAPLGEVADLDSHGDSHSSEQSEVRPAEPAANYASNAGSYAQSAASGNVGSALFGAPAVGSSESHGAGSAHGASAYGASAYGASSGSFGAGAASFAPAATSSFAPVTSNNMFSSAPSLSPSSLGQSTGPVALNVDEDSVPARRGRGWRPERWLLAVAGVVGAGIVGYNVMGSSSSSVAAAEKPAAAATAAASHAYEPPAEHGTTRPAAVKDEPAVVAKADEGKDAPIGSVPSSSPEEKEEATEAPSSAKGAKDTKDSDSLRGGVAKAFNGKKGSSSKASSSGKSAKGGKSHGKTPSRATASRATSSSSKASKKPSVAHAQSAFDPLNGSLP